MKKLVKINVVDKDKNFVYNIGKMVIEEGSELEIQKEDIYYFKDGDVLVSEEDGTIIIFHDIVTYCQNAYFYACFIKPEKRLDCYTDHYYGKLEEFRHASTTEIQEMIDALKKNNKYWDPIGKRIVNIEKRAKANGLYYRVNSFLNVEVVRKIFSEENNKDYNNGNYFPSFSKAEEKMKEMRENNSGN